MKNRLAVILSAIFLAACSNDGPPDEPPGKARTNRFGYTAPYGVIVGADNQLGWFKAAVSGARKAEGQAPANLVRLEAAENCSFPAPGENDFLAQVFAESADQPSDVIAFSDRDILDRANTYIKRWQALGKDPGIPGDRGGDRLEVVDVVVTRASQPVYLVLAGGRNILWNIHKAENVKISRVAIIGAGDAGVANLDDGVPVSVLAGGDAVRCRVNAFMRPQKHWQIVKMADEGDRISKEAVGKRLAAYNRYDSWFMRTFRSRSEPVTVGFDSMSHAIVGAMPHDLDQRVAYRPLEGATVRITKADYAFVAASKSDYDAVHAPLVAKKATQIFGSELSALNRTQ